MSDESAVNPAIARVIRAVTAFYEISESALHNHRRLPHLVRARLAACWILRFRVKASWHQIGEALHRDHTTGISNAQAASRLAKSDDQFALELAAVWKLAQSWAPTYTLVTDGGKYLH